MPTNTTNKSSKTSQKTNLMQLTTAKKEKFLEYLERNGLPIPKGSQSTQDDSQIASNVSVSVFDECIKDITTRTDMDKEECTKFLHDHGLALMLQNCKSEELDIVEASANGENDQLLTDYIFSNLENTKNYILGFFQAYNELLRALGLKPKDGLNFITE